MIRSFRHRGLKRFYERDDASQVHAAYRKKVARILADLDSARMPRDMDFPGLRLHPLTGEFPLPTLPRKRGRVGRGRA